MANPIIGLVFEMCWRIRMFLQSCSLFSSCIRLVTDSLIYLSRVQSGMDSAGESKSAVIAPKVCAEL